MTNVIPISSDSDLKASALDQVYDAVIAIDNERRVTYWNAGASRLYGVAPAEAIGQRIQDIRQSEWMPSDEAESQRVLAESGVWRGENVQYLKNGRKIHVDATVSLLRDADQNTIGLLAVLRDITERKRAEESRIASEERLRFMADTMPQIVWMAHPNGHLKFINARFVTYAGMDEAAILQQGLPVVLAPEERAAAEIAWRAAVVAKQPFEAEYRLRRAIDGVYRWHLVRAEPQMGPDGETLHWIGTCTDIDDQKRAEQENARLLEQVRTALAHQAVMLRDVLLGVTEGCLTLCLSCDDLPALLPESPLAPETILLNESNLRELRRACEAVTSAPPCSFPEERIQDLITCVGEAALNAVVHGGGGTVRIGVRESASDGDAGCTVQVWIRDEGTGIGDLTKAIAPGYTTKGTMGHGFSMMLRTADRIFLQTGPSGTTVVVEIDRTAALPSWLRDRL